MVVKNINIWENPLLQQINVLPSRTEKEIIPNKNQKIISLNGDWYFKLFPIASQVDMDEISKIDVWDKIVVPCPWQTQGFGTIDYTNFWYKFPIIFPKVSNKNPTGVYKKRLKIDSLENDKSYILKFGACDSCMRLFVNGVEVGMTKGSRYIAEFDISKYIKNENEIIAIVYKWSDGTYFEDQGQWWFSGLYRDVELIIEPRSRINDFFIQTDRINDTEYMLKIDLWNSFEKIQDVNIKLFDDNQIVINENVSIDSVHNKFVWNLKNVKQWNAETPYLYKIEFTYNQNTIVANVGFREIKIDNQIFKINDKPIMFKGVNFHSYAPKNGKYATKSQVKEQLMLMKEHNINAIRTSHYPQPQFFYDLCDEIGFYVISEADLEAHGFIYSNFSELANNNDCENSFILRGTRMVQNFKNHPSIIMWSLGNETGFGKNFVSMKMAMKKIDNTRPFHLESDYECEISDVHSRMYSHIENYEGSKHWITTLDTPIDGKDSSDIVHPNWLNRPRMECEYGHAMGTGPGSLADYMEKFYSNPAWCGGFIWEWQDMGIYDYDQDAHLYKEYWKYASDFAHEPSSGNIIVMDGLVFSDGKPRPCLNEYKAVCSPIHFKYKNNIVTITNRYDFKTLDNIITIAKIIDHNNKILWEKDINIKGLKARNAQTFEIPQIINDNKSYFLILESKLIDPEFALESNHELIKTSFNLNHNADFEHDLKVCEVLPKLIDNKFDINIIHNDLKIIFDKNSGRLKSLFYNDEEVINNGPSFNMWRATIDNDLNNLNWTDTFFVNLVDDNVEDIRYFIDENNNLILEIEIISGAINQAWYFRNIYKYTFKYFNSIVFEMDSKLEFSIDKSKVKEKDLKGFCPEYVPRLGIFFNLNKNFKDFTFFGRGPLETYSDMCLANSYGMYSNTINNSFTPNARPQSSSNHMQSVWLKTKSNNCEFTICAKDSKHFFDFTYLPFSEKHISKSKHLNELIPDNVNWLYIDYMQNGLGSNSCGPIALKKYWCNLQSFEIKQIWEFKNL